MYMNLTLSSRFCCEHLSPIPLYIFSWSIFPVKDDAVLHVKGRLCNTHHSCLKNSTNWLWAGQNTNLPSHQKVRDHDITNHWSRPRWAHEHSILRRSHASLSMVTFFGKSWYIPWIECFNDYKPPFLWCHLSPFTPGSALERAAKFMITAVWKVPQHMNAV